jgi:hypothetical protein
MAKYGIDYYGDSYYGSNTLVQFNAGNFKATPVNYGKIQLTWDTPSGSWDFIRLLRNAYGYPIAADDGDVLFEQANPGAIFYQDSGQSPTNVGLKPGKIYYYTLFVKETVHGTWQSAGTTEGTAVKNYNTSETMNSYLPEILRSNVPYDNTVDSSNDFLKRFLQLFAFQLDMYKTQAENVANRYDIANVDGKLIPVLMEQFGISYEPYIGLKQSRILLQNIARLSQNKGTLAGTKEFIKAYAGYDNSVTVGKNLMLDINDSSFEQSIGSWVTDTSNATLSQYLATASPVVAPYAEPTAPPLFPSLQNAVLKVQATASATVILKLLGDSPLHYGIPVRSFTTYTFSGYAQTDSTARAISAKVQWYDINGNPLTASSYGSTASDATNSWTRFSVSATAPSLAAYAVPYIKIASAVTSEIHYLDALQFEAASSATAFEDARQLHLTLLATRINEILNPNLYFPQTFWSVINGTITLSTSAEDILGVDGSITNSSEAGEIYAADAGLVTLNSSAMNVFANNDYTFSIYVAATDAGDVPTPVTAQISWYDSSSSLISVVQGVPLTATRSFVRPFATGTAPANAVTAVVSLTWTATAAGSPTQGNQIVVDSALFEKSAFVNAYFDGSNGVAELSDLFWEGSSPNAARSHYYRNRFAVESRLIAKLPNWLHYGTTFQLLFAQPNT